ncbi:MAG: hypothetical protein K0S26_1144 [Bacteroidota bacterium]|nr:hypothetical protein [Bacteroidota bacterium]
MLYGLNRILENGAAKFSSAVAFRDLNGNFVSYAQLLLQAKNTGEFLLTNGVGEGDRVGIIGSKSIAYVTAMFGVMSCKAAYIPIDVNAPLLRNMSVIEDCNLKAVLISNKEVEKYEAAFSPSRDYNKIHFDEEFSLMVFKHKTKSHKENLSYILYTSGSTGVPKGVMHTHESALAFINWSVETFKPNSADVFCSNAPFHFDLSVFDLFVPLCVGASVVLFDVSVTSNPLRLSCELSQNKISFFYSTPTTLTYMHTYGKLNRYSYSSLKCVLFAGEIFPISDLRKIKEIWHDAKFHNLYGPTETNVCSYYIIPDEISKEQIDPFPIGKACSFAFLKINGPQAKGELLVAGSSVMSGYWNDPDKTREAFKDGIDDTNSTEIIAHVALKKGCTLSEADLYQYCKIELPGYMTPDRFKFHKQLPLTSTHKIDYKTLSSVYD